MTSSFPAWFDSIARDGSGNWMLDGLVPDGGQTLHQPFALKDSARVDMVQLGVWSRMRAETFFEEAGIFLGSGQRILDARPVLAKLMPGLQISNNHAVYRFDVGDRVYLIPALFLLGRMFLSVNGAAKYLLQPGMLESFVDPLPKVENDRVTLRLPPHIATSRCNEGLARTMAWLALDRTAERSWKSVWFNLVTGTIDLSLPDIRMNGRVGGYEIEGVHLVTWSRELTFSYGLPSTLIVTGKRGTERVFTKGRWAKPQEPD